MGALPWAGVGPAIRPPPATARGGRKPTDSLERGFGRGTAPWGAPHPRTPTQARAPLGARGGGRAGLGWHRSAEGGDTPAPAAALRHVAAPLAVAKVWEFGGHTGLAGPAPPLSPRGPAWLHSLGARTALARKAPGAGGAGQAGPLAFEGWSSGISPPRPRPAARVIVPAWEQRPLQRRRPRRVEVPARARARALVHSLRLPEPRGGPDTPATESMNGERERSLVCLHSPPLPRLPPGRASQIQSDKGPRGGGGALRGRARGVQVWLETALFIYSRAPGQRGLVGVPRPPAPEPPRPPPRWL